ncbi:uncharacterized protein SPSK_01282 [Sporothrix schenckii 1099-18]|uniref:Uncharacterized protein n=1 Tax=Sporothrix schenckii 1099-18 TaxID=1397361 RepID=A0A0F2LVA1_SPOSC|nr:uncharacterized protein SPSK_01282 [Sporothrix schenckii 1099-18]KJR81392.1 hypothetical protein SPSK_01282 [Sporothrix schenckii 1099-18]
MCRLFRGTGETRDGQTTDGENGHNGISYHILGALEEKSVEKRDICLQLASSPNVVAFTTKGPSETKVRHIADHEHEKAGPMLVSARSTLSPTLSCVLVRAGRARGERPSMDITDVI